MIERTGWIREQAPHKPAHLGEFGLADDKWRITEQMQRNPEVADIHNALWASGLSGASATAMFWWWERIDQRQAYTNYYALSRFLADVPWTSGHVRQLQVSIIPTEKAPNVRALGLQTNGEAWLWCFNKAASWTNLVAAGSHAPPAMHCGVELNVGRPGTYRVSWHKTSDLASLRSDEIQVTGEIMQLQTPDFAHDLACRIHLIQ